MNHTYALLLNSLHSNAYLDFVKEHPNGDVKDHVVSFNNGKIRMMMTIA